MKLQLASILALVSVSALGAPTSYTIDPDHTHPSFDVAKYPKAEYKGQFVDFANGAPKTISGQLTLHGVTKPVTLTINSFKCIDHPMLKKQVCGADASGSFNRADFGVNYGQQYGFKQDVLLRIQVEGVKAN